MAQPSRTRARIAFGLALLCTLFMAKSEIARPILPDFQVYLTAAQLVRAHNSAGLYDEGANGQDPQLRYATPSSPFAKTALAKGISGVRLYLYPPALADALVPLAYLSLNHACDAWMALNVLGLLLAAIFLTRLVGARIFSQQSLTITLCLFVFRPNLTAFHVGQVSLLLLLLWAMGIFFCKENSPRTSALMFALATVIKLTPLLVIVPLLLWKEYKWVRWYAIFLAASIVTMLALNGPATLGEYALHVLPSMSGGIASVGNLSLQSAIQVLYVGLTGGNVAQVFLSVPASIVTVGKLFALAVLAAAITQLYRLRRHTGPLASPSNRATILSLVAILSVCVAPVSWRHAYSVAFLALLFLWKEALQRGATNAALALLTFTTIEFAFVLDTVAIKLVTVTGSTHGVLPALIPALAPVTGLALVFYTLAHMHRSPIDEIATPDSR